MEYYRRDRKSTLDPGFIRMDYHIVDPATNKVHAEINIKGRMPESTYSDYNNTATNKPTTPPDQYYREGDQLPLFRANHEPGYAVVDFMEGSERGRTHAMRALAIAQNDLDNKMGPAQRVRLEPSTDLSEHSLRLSRNLQSRGLLNSDVDLPAEATNSMDFVSEDYMGQHDDDTGFEKVSKEDLRAGKSTMRRLLNIPDKRPAPINPEQFTQGTLF